jgi:hypothetical protein
LRAGEAPQSLPGNDTARRSCSVAAGTKATATGGDPAFVVERLEAASQWFSLLLHRQCDYVARSARAPYRCRHSRVVLLGLYRLAPGTAPSLILPSLRISRDRLVRTTTCVGPTATA